MLLKIGIVVVALIVVGVVGILVAAAAKPDTFRVARTAEIKAPPERIFPLMDDFRRFGAWSPYEKRDPDMKRSYSGPESGKGAVYAWEGNKNVGSGRMEILDSTPASKVVIKLDFMSPFQAHNLVEFTLVPHDGSTTVGWIMEGPVPFIGKIMHVFMNMDRMVGGDFETGLANLKLIAEKQSTASN
jgi:uncharacterized protein YndB with AHSA1/START domain